MSDDGRRVAPSAGRNRDAIWDVLRPQLPDRGVVLEVASGSGEHVVHFASAVEQNHRELTFQPSDPDLAARTSIDAWVSAAGVTRVRPAISLDAIEPTWPITQADAVVCINMIHIAPWAAAVGLLEGAARILTSNGLLFLYGPFHRDGAPTSPGNAQFDAQLRAQNSDWGVRDLETVEALGEGLGLLRTEIIEMPANNLSLVFRHSGVKA